MTFELGLSSSQTRVAQAFTHCGRQQFVSEPCLAPGVCVPHCPCSLWLCRLGGSDSSRRRGAAAPSLRSQGHCVGGAGASPPTLHQYHQRGPDPRHSCLQDQKASLFCGKPENHGEQVALLIIRARQKTRQPLENLVAYWYSENIGLVFRGQ